MLTKAAAAEIVQNGGALEEAQSVLRQGHAAGPDLQDAGIPILPAEMVERAAFRAIMQIGGTIYDLGPGDVANPEAAIENAEAVAAAVVDYLKGHVKGDGA